MLNFWSDVGETKSGWAGDFLLVMGTQRIPASARAEGAWELACETEGARLYFTQPTAGWRGSPLRHFSEGSRKFWLLGEVWGSCADLGPQDWPGHFILLGWDALEKKWQLWTDRMGSFHAYYTVGGKGGALGTFSPSVAGFGAKKLNLPALLEFFAYGFFLGDHTQFEDLKIVRPATHLVFDESGEILTQEKLRKWRFEPDEHISADEALEGFAGIFQQVIREQVNGRRVAFPISGGLDSRSTVAALPKGKTGENIWSYSYGYTPNSVETYIAAQIASARELPFRKFTIQPYLFEKLPLILDSVEGFQDVTQCRQAAVVEELASHADFVMAAHWGDVWLSDMGLLDKSEAQNEAGFLEQAHKKFYKKNDWLVSEFCKAALPGFDRTDYLRESLNAEITPLAGIPEADFRLKILKVEAWCFRWTNASLRMFQPGAFPLLPFYDPRLVDFFCQLPTRVVRGRDLQIAYLKRNAPELARIRWQVYDANLYFYRYFNSLLLPRRAVKKLGRALSSEPVLQRNWEVQFFAGSGREKLSEAIARQGLKAGEFFAPEAMEALLDHFYSAPSAKDAYALSMLLTFSSWLERYA